MKPILYLLLPLSASIGFSSCQSSGEVNQQQRGHSLPDSTRPGYPFTGELAELKKVQVSVYCGECVVDCETRFCLVNTGEAPELRRLVVPSGGTTPSDCGEEWKEEKKKQILSNFIARLPQWVTQSTRRESRLGHPDERDQCGYGCRLEFKSGKVIDFLVDTDENPLSGDTLRWQRQIAHTIQTLQK